MSSGIYQIENQINGKRYIGSAVNLRKRWGEHLNTLCHKRHFNRHLQSAFDKYGEDAFTFEILEYVMSEDLIVREQFYLDTYSPEYNISPTAGSLLGIQHTDETRANMSIAKTGKRHPMYGKHPNPETLAKLSVARTGERNPNYGKHHSAVACKKMHEAWTLERKQAQSDRQQGKHLSAETCAKISASRTGERHPMYGKHHSAATKRKMSTARKTYWRRIRETENQ